MVGNKSDLYEFQEVSNDEGMALAKELKAIFQNTSAKETSGGIDTLFINIGKKFLDPSCEITSNMTKDELKSKGEKIMRDKIKNNKNQKKKVLLVINDIFD